MKITKEQLQKVIQEELAAELKEEEMAGALGQLSKWKEQVFGDAGDAKVLQNIGNRLKALNAVAQAEFIVAIVQDFGLMPDATLMKNALIKGAQAAKGGALRPELPKGKPKTAQPKPAHRTGIARMNPADAFWASHGKGPGADPNL